MELLNESVLGKKSEMYAMIISIETDFIANFRDSLELSDIPQEIVNRAKSVKEETNPLMAVLRGLDIQAYIEICNSNIIKLGINSAQKNFINNDLTKIIPVRNAVMHPRPLGFFDYAMLKAVFDDIPIELKCFFWKSIEITRLQIKERPETLLPPPETLRKSNRIIENLPSLVDYEETSFIGRKKEIGEIKAQLNRKNVSILSIIGDGGVGKTATTLKLLYDMLDDPNCKYEMIIWTSLKTNELSDFNFSEIVDSIKTTAEMYESLASFVGENSIENTKDFLIELAQNFNTLFVLDNLETINTAEIREFVDLFSEYGQVLITSRIGLGEMEHRYKLNGLNDKDVLAYSDVLLDLYGFECLLSDERKRELVIHELHSNPLAIKWFVRCLYNGQDENQILMHKEDVINFCMANVYEKLSSNAHNVLDILTIAGVDVELSFPELMYYIEGNLSNCNDIKYAINELGKCNFINEEKFRRDNSIAVTEFAHEFLMLHFSETKYRIAQFKELEKRLISFGQQLLIKGSEDEYSIRSLRYKTKSELVAAYFLSNALSLKPEENKLAIENVKYTQELLPMYYENNLVLAYIYGPSSPLKARSEFRNAIKLCMCSDEKVRVHIIYADFLIRLNDYPEAITILSQVETLDTNCEVKFQKAKVLSYIVKYDDAEGILDDINLMPLSNSNLNRLLTMRADIKRRCSELVDIRETQKRLAVIKEAFSYLSKATNPDNKIFDYMVKILSDLVYMHTDDEALEYILEIENKYYQQIKNASSYKKLKILIREKLPQMQNERFKREISRYITDYNEHLELLKINEALVYSIKEGYGFCKNKEFPQGIYFSMAGLPQNINYGDILEYSCTLTSKGKVSVVSPKRIGSIDDRII